MSHACANTSSCDGSRTLRDAQPLVAIPTPDPTSTTTLTQPPASATARRLVPAWHLDNPPRNIADVLRGVVRLQLSVLAYNLGNLWRRLGLPNRIKSWSLTSLQHRLMKTGGRLVKHARYYWLLLAEGHLNRRLFGDMLHRIWALPLPSG